MAEIPLKILVPIKRVVDYRVKIRVKSDGSGIVTEHVKMSMNPFDEIAVEEAIRLKEKKWADEIIVVSVGDNSVQETLRGALALGADRAILIETEQPLHPRAIAKILQKIVQQETPRLVIMGKQAIDGDHNQTGQMLAATLQWAIGTFISKLETAADHVVVTREVDAGLEQLRLTLPAVVTTDLRLNQPRFATLPNIMQSKQKTLQVIPLADLLLDTASHCHTLSVEPPPTRVGGEILADVNALVEKLQQGKFLS